MSKDRRSHDQKRKARLAKRASRRTVVDDLSPYSGKKYQADAWVPHVFRTERPIYEAIELSGRRLTNDQVREALIHLIKYLRAGGPAPLGADEPEVPFAPGNEVAFLVWNIRRHWELLFQEQGPVHEDDLVGILRTLLNSLVAHAWNTGRDRGYVAFLYDFMRRMA